MAAADAVEPDDGEIMLAAEIQETAQRANLPLDGGESQLAAMAMRRVGSTLLTGDKRAVAALEQVAAALNLLAQAAGTVLCLEQAMASLTRAYGAAPIRAKVCADPAADATLSICFGCHSASGFREAEIWASLASYIADLRSHAPTILRTGDDASCLLT